MQATIPRSDTYVTFNVRPEFGGSVITWSGTSKTRIDKNQVVESREDIGRPTWESVEAAGRKLLVNKLATLDYAPNVQQALGKKMPLLGYSTDRAMELSKRFGSLIAKQATIDLNDTAKTVLLDRISRGVNVELFTFDAVDTKEIISFNKQLPLLDISLLKIASAELTAFAKAKLTLSYEFHGGVDLTGVFLTDTNRIALQGSIQGGIEGKVKAAGIVTAGDASGSLGLVLSAKASINAGDGLYLREIRQSPRSYVNASFDLDLIAHVEAHIGPWTFLDFDLLKVDLIKFDVKATPPVLKSLPGYQLKGRRLPDSEKWESQVDVLIADDIQDLLSDDSDL